MLGWEGTETHPASPSCVEVPASVMEKLRVGFAFRARPHVRAAVMLLVHGFCLCPGLVSRWGQVAAGACGPGFIAGDVSRRVRSCSVSGCGPGNPMTPAAVTRPMLNSRSPVTWWAFSLCSSGAVHGTLSRPSPDVPRSWVTSLQEEWAPHCEHLLVATGSELSEAVRTLVTRSLGLVLCA